MAKLIRFFLSCCSVCFLSATSIGAQDISVLLDRTVKGTELYLAGQAQLLLTVFDVAENSIPMTSDRVDFAAFCQGTWDIGDTLLEKSEISIDSQPAHFEAMSFMLHPITDRLPFQTPIDGMIAIGVCNSAQSPAGYKLNELAAYVGYYSTVSAIDAPVTFKLPDTLSRAVTIEVFDYEPDGRSSHYVKSGQAGEEIGLIRQEKLSMHLINIFLGVFCGALAIFFFRGFGNTGPSSMAV